jgi:biopolymer transport protein ExbB/TolQ
VTAVTAEVVEPPLSWVRQDIEQRLGFRGGRFTRVNNWLTLLLGFSATVAFYLILSFFPWLWLAQSFTKRGPTPYAIAFFSFWALAILAIKWSKLTLQQQSLKYDVVPPDHDFVLSASTADQVVEGIHAVVDDARHFVLFNRIMIALSNLKNLGRVTDVDEILRSQGEHDESSMETSYSLVRGFVWAIPVLGFIGTVLGLSEAIGGFSSVLQSTTEVEHLVEALKIVTGGLATAFETTLQALVAALVIQILLTFLKRGEEEFLDGCSEYCLRRIVNRLRLMPYQQE